MSQFFVGVTDSNLPVDVPTSFTTDVRDNSTSTPGTAIPAANVLEILARDTSQSNDNGIRTDADPNNGDTVYVELTNRVSGTGTTVSGPATTALITLALDDESTYLISVDIVGFATAGGTGIISAREVATFYRTGGGLATIIGAVDSNQELLNLLPFLAYTSASGNNVVVNAFGSIGYTISWKAILTYTKVS